MKSNTKDIKKRIRKISKLEWIVILLVLCLLVTLAIFAMTTSTDGRFTRATIRGIENSWKLENGEIELQSQGEETNFINVEYAAVYRYKRLQYKSDNMSKIAMQYISALKGCKEAAEKYDPEKNFDKFWAEFSPYYGQRIKALYALYKENPLAFKNIKKEYKADFDNLIINGWALDKTENIRFEKKKDKNGHTLFIAKVINDSDYDIETINLDIELLNDKDKVIDAASAYAENWKVGEEKSLQFYSASSKVKRYRIVAETCELKVEKNEQTDK